MRKGTAKEMERAATSLLEALAAQDLAKQKVEFARADLVWAIRFYRDGKP